MTARARYLVTWIDDVVERLGHAAALVECAVLAGGVRHETYRRKLDLVAVRLRGLTGAARTLAGPRGPIDWVAAFALEVRRLEVQLGVCVKFRVCQDALAEGDLAMVARELGGVAAEAELLAAPLRTASGAS